MFGRLAQGARNLFRRATGRGGSARSGGAAPRAAGAAGGRTNLT